MLSSTLTSQGSQASIRYVGRTQKVTGYASRPCPMPMTSICEDALINCGRASIEARVAQGVYMKASMPLSEAPGN